LPRGIDGASVARVEVGPIAALVSELSAAEYGEKQWREHAQDPRWLQHVATEHHAVLQAVSVQTDVLPLRLPGIHHDSASLQRALLEQQSELEAALDTIRGQIELGAKVFLVAERPTPEPEHQPRTGRDYLLRRSAEASSRETGRLRRQQLLLDLHEQLTNSSSRSTVNPPQEPALTGRQEPMLLDTAYLLPRERIGDFITLAEQLNEALAADGMALEITGPWPVYNFADVPDSTGLAGAR
jgi:hypothetical protein